MNRQARTDGRSAYGDPASPEAEDFEMVSAQSTLAGAEYVMVDHPDGTSYVEANDAAKETNKATASLAEENDFEIVKSYATMYDAIDASYYVKVNVAGDKECAEPLSKDFEEFEMVGPQSDEATERDATITGIETNGNSQAEENEEFQQEEELAFESEQNDCEQAISFIHAL